MLCHDSANLKKHISIHHLRVFLCLLDSIAIPVFSVHLLVWLEVMNETTNFDIDEILELRANYMRWADIATMKGTLPRTLHRWRKRVNFEEPTYNIDDEDLDHLLANYFDCNPRRGERMAVGHIRSLNYRVSI